MNCPRLHGEIAVRSARRRQRLAQCASPPPPPPPPPPQFELSVPGRHGNLASSRMYEHTHLRPRHRVRPSTLRRSLPTTDIADSLFSHTNVGSSLLMAMFIAEHCAPRRNG